MSEPSLLEYLLVVDPMLAVAESISDQCHRMAKNHLLATTAEDAIQKIHAHRPECLILSLELPQTHLINWFSQIKTEHNPFIIATYRELSVNMMDRLRGIGVEDFLPQPIDPTELFRIVSRRFKLAFRRHVRFPVNLAVLRLDETLMGETFNLSEGGMALDLYQPLSVDDSILLKLALPKAIPTVDHALDTIAVRCRILHVQELPRTGIRARVQFEKLRGKEREVLLQYIKHLEAEYRERERGFDRQAPVV